VSFDIKKWLDQHVVPLLAGEPQALIHSELHRGDPPEEVLVFLQAKEPGTWPLLAKRILETSGFSFDYLREQAMVRVGDSIVNIFGGDGAPFFNKNGMALARFYKAIPEGDRHIGLILDVGGKYETPGLAADAVKHFFSLFEISPLQVCADHRPTFGG